MNPIRSWFDRLTGLLPVPRSMSDEPPTVDPRVDPATMEAYGERQLAQFGVGQGHMGSAPLPSHYAIEDAVEARTELKRQVDAVGSADADARVDADTAEAVSAETDAPAAAEADEGA